MFKLQVQLQDYVFSRIPPQNISLGGNGHVHLSIITKHLDCNAQFPGYLSLSASLASQQVVLLGFSPSPSGPNRQIHQRYWCFPTIIALLVRAAFLFRVPSSPEYQRVGPLYFGCPVYIILHLVRYSIQLPASTLSFNTHTLHCFQHFEIHQLLITTLASQCVPGRASSSGPSKFTFPFGYLCLSDLGC